MQVLVSVNSVQEAQMVLSAGVTLIDLKDTSHGALAALDLEVSRSIVQAVQAYASSPAANSVLISGTIGDDCASTAALVADIESRLAIGLHIIKLPETIWGNAAFIPEIQRLLNAGVRLIAVLSPQRLRQPMTLANTLRQLAESGYLGVMVDTIDKSAAVVDVLDHAEIDLFVTLAKSMNLFVGVAGGLQLRHVTSLITLQSDYLGFRGGLCNDGRRKSALEPEMVEHLMERVSETVANLSVTQ